MLVFLYLTHATGDNCQQYMGWFKLNYMSAFDVNTACRLPANR